MEENDDIIYDLEHAEAAEEQEAQTTAESPEKEGGQEEEQQPEHAETPVEPDEPEKPEGPQGQKAPEAPESPEAPDDPDPAKAEIDRLVEEMGAATLLDIIRDNRNAAIRQIISEVEEACRLPLASGQSTAKACRSIFDLAALA